MNDTGSDVACVMPFVPFVPLCRSKPVQSKRSCATHPTPPLLTLSHTLLTLSLFFSTKLIFGTVEPLAPKTQGKEPMLCTSFSCAVVLGGFASPAYPAYPTWSGRRAPLSSRSLAHCCGQANGAARGPSLPSCSLAFLVSLGRIATVLLSSPCMHTLRVQT